MVRQYYVLQVTELSEQELQAVFEDAAQLLQIEQQLIADSIRRLLR